MEVHESENGDTYIGGKEINDHMYVLIAYPEGSGMGIFNEIKQTVAVFGAEENRGIPDHPNLVDDYYDEIIRKSTRDPVSLDRFISQTLNEAICEIEAKKEEQQKIKDKIDAALESNKFVHEDDL